MEQLRSVRDNVPLDWIGNMIRVQPKSRLNPQQLMSQITECDDAEQYCGGCCDGKELNPAHAQVLESDVEDDDDDTGGGM